MNIEEMIINARAELYRKATISKLSIAYAQHNRIDLNAIAGFCGCLAIMPVAVHPGDMFDFGTNDEADIDAVIIEAFDQDGETTIDLAAWPVDHPETVLTMFRRAPLLGMWHALSPFSYHLGRPLNLYRTPLEWLQANCQGAAILRPDPGVRMLLDAHGPIAARDRAHAVEIIDMQASLDRRRLVVPKH